MKSLAMVTILDISRLLPGGYASLLLCEMGARVIKVEQPGVGDYQRAVIPGGLLPSHTRVIHQGKESLALDLKSKEGREIFLKLVKKSDVVIESFRPHVLDKMGLGFRSLRKIQPKIILCSITGFGQKGPRASLAGHDMNFVGLSGLFHKMRDRSGRPVLPDFQIADMAVGMEAAMKISAALVERQKTKRGQHIDCSMLGAARSWSRFCEFEDRSPTILGGALVRYGLYETADSKWMTLGALEDKFWKKFCEVIEKPEWYLLNFEEEKGIRADLENIFKEKTQKEWAELGKKEDICLFPVEENPDLTQYSKKTPYVGEQTRKILKLLGCREAV